VFASNSANRLAAEHRASPGDADQRGVVEVSGEHRDLNGARGDRLGDGASHLWWVAAGLRGCDGPLMLGLVACDAFVIDRRCWRRITRRGVCAAALVVLLGAVPVQATRKPVMRSVTACRSAGARCVDARYAFDLAISPDGHHLYALILAPDEQRATGVLRLIGWSIDERGALSADNPVACMEQPSSTPLDGCEAVAAWPPLPAMEDHEFEGASIAISGDGGHVYVAGLDTVTVFNRDSGTGTLGRTPGPAGCLARKPAERPGCGQARGIRGPLKLAVSADGVNVYLLSHAPKTAGVAVFTRDPVVGTLAQLPGAAGCVSTGLAGCGRARQLNQPEDLAVAQDGTHVYLASANNSEQGGGIATFARDQDTGELSQPNGRRGCVNERGSRGCSRDPRIGSRSDIAIAAQAHVIYSIGIDRGEGPRITPLDAHGGLRRSTSARPYPRVAAGLSGLAAAGNGRVYAYWELGGLFAYSSRASGTRLHLDGCWMEEIALAPCRRARGLSLATPGLVVSPNSRFLYLVGGMGGIAMIDLR
jgi:hypothetical protein